MNRWTEVVERIRRGWLTHPVHKRRGMKLFYALEVTLVVVGVALGIWRGGLGYWSSAVFLTVVLGWDVYRLWRRGGPDPR